MSKATPSTIFPFKFLHNQMQLMSTQNCHVSWKQRTQVNEPKFHSSPNWVKHSISYIDQITLITTQKVDYFAFFTFSHQTKPQNPRPFSLFFHFLKLYSHPSKPNNYITPDSSFTTISYIKIIDSHSFFSNSFNILSAHSSIAKKF